MQWLLIKNLDANCAAGVNDLVRQHPSAGGFALALTRWVLSLSKHAGAKKAKAGRIKSFASFGYPPKAEKVTKNNVMGNDPTQANRSASLKRWE